MNYSRAVNKTISYASFFDFPLSPRETHYWLITDQPVSFSEIKFHLKPLSSRDKKRRRELELNTLNKIKHAESLTPFLYWIPFLRFVGITGSVAAHNANFNDDIDLILITSPHTIWIVRPLVLLIISLFFCRRHPHDNKNYNFNAFCPNMWLDTSSLKTSSSHQNLYTAHEILQIHPILDKSFTYQSLLYVNKWVKGFLANTYQIKAKSSFVPKPKSDFVYLLFYPFNYLLFLLQMVYMIPKRTSEVVQPHRAFLHTTNFSIQINRFLTKDSKRYN